MPRLKATIPARIKAGSEADASGCWEWRLYKDRDGYGHISLHGRDWLAHRASYVAFVGPIPDGLTIDHLCRNPGCVNPKHLEPVTNKENILRGESVTACLARQTRCKRGHLLLGDNLYLDRHGRRHCRQCNVIRTREYKLRKREAS